jgi:CO/xanthine dehydrogenase FAD-binding subunit
MKPAAFEYERARTLAGAVARLATHGPDAKLIAGGQSLVPMLAMRLLRPTLLVDIRELDELKQIRIDADSVRVGACVPQCEALDHVALGQAVPLLAKALRWVGHVQTRNRGTIGGSVVHADPCAELPLVVRVLDAGLEACAVSGTSMIAAGEFFTGPLSTALDPEACLAAIHFPRWREGALGSAFDEVSIRHGDFALVAAAAQLTLDADGRCTRVVLGVGGAGSTPLALERAAAGLVGTRLEDAAIDAAAGQASREVDPGDDQHASAEYRRDLVRVLSIRVLRAARAEARTHTSLQS